MEKVNAAQILFDFVARVRPDVYDEILRHIRPYSLAGILRLFQHHLRRSVPDLRVLNARPERVPAWCLDIVVAMRRQCPSPGDAFGIQLTCRLTKSDTQGTLDSKHVSSSSTATSAQSFNVSKEVRYELDLFTNHTQLFELANTHVYASVFTKHYSVTQLMARLPDACLLEKGYPLNKGRNAQGEFKYLKDYTFIVTENRVLYKSFRHLLQLIQRLEMEHVVALTDVRYLFHKCGLVSFYFNLDRIASIQLLRGVSPDCVYSNDTRVVLKYLCCTGQPLPMTRDGLVKNPQRSPLEVLSFEAPKKNYARLCTLPATSYPVRTSDDKIFFGQQFNEGTGYRFDLRPSSKSF